ncbi:hypothetical protein [Microlunatus soli]|uniref:MinD-like ATPase involved in chromosome partitioning or flagellar assembly n=1 Tax=Microlunatus soli TaxID=630515 RepID=A0A1H1UNU5_9ACTN|nr:hypothetical protein [Microlunatus soli]SDS73971.1 hypothetical protein SAMN04489812_2862 [Microlunatus soli]
MALIVMASAAGAPGVTSAAVGLAMTWTQSVIMVDADPGAHQAVLAGYLRGQVPTGKGLQRVAEAHRDRRPLAEAVSDETIPLADESAAATTGSATSSARSDGTSRRLLPGFARPANAALFGPVWPDLADTFVGYEQAGIDVLVDVGRLGGDGVPQALVDRADLVLLVTRSNLRSIAAARGCCLRLREQSRLTGNESNLGLILIGENQPYGRREIANLLSIPVVSVIADDVESAAVFSDGARRSRKFGRSPLARSLHRATEEIGSQIRRRRARLGLDEPQHEPALEPLSLEIPGDQPAPGQSAVPPAPTGAAASQTAPSRTVTSQTGPSQAGPSQSGSPQTGPSQPATSGAPAASAMNAWIRAGNGSDGERHG